jgi:hypothetical protein
MLRHYLGNRKKGYVFINERTGNRLTDRNFEKEIDKWAKLLNIQKLQPFKPSGKNYHLVTLMALREAGERHHDLNGGDPDVSTKAAGHSKETKARYYKKVSAGTTCKAPSCIYRGVMTDSLTNYQKYL